VETEHLVNGAVNHNKLAFESVHSEHIANEAISTEHISEQSITTEHIQEEAISTELLRNQSVTADKLANQSVTSEKLNFNPVQTKRSQGRTIQQFGMVPFNFSNYEEQVEVTITFDEAYSNVEYAIVGMTNHNACYPVLKEKTRTSAILQIIRNKVTPHPVGMLTWIAIGEV
jgi:hypothetical protein